MILPVNDRPATNDAKPTAAFQPLDAIPAGQCARVRQVQATDADTERLMAMGVCVGRQLQVIKWGDPMILRVLGSRLGVSARLARQVLVEVCLPDHCPLP